MENSDGRTGLLIVNTGDGKGKTTAALGLALRTIGHGGRVFFLQFLKGRPDTGECSAAAQHLPQLEIKQFGTPSFVIPGTISPHDQALAHEGLALAKSAISSGQYSLVVLDEVNVAIGLGLLATGEVLEAVVTRPVGVSVVLTGRGAPPEIVEAADLVSEIKEIKHPYRKGIPAQPGIEF